MRGGGIEEKAPCGKKHVICVPSLCAIKEDITRVEGTSKGGVIYWIKFVEGVESVIRDSRRINEKITNEIVEGGILLRGRGR